MIREVKDSDYLVFTTQDVKFNSDINFSIVDTIATMQSVGAVGGCFRHESPIPAMNGVFDNIFKNLPYSSYLLGEWKYVNWWSNNFAIYHQSIIRKIPFPEPVTWAEDLAWAKQVSALGYPLLVTTKHSIRHLNHDSIASSFKRGLDNGKGIYEIAKFFSEPLPRLTLRGDLFRAVFGMFILELRYHKRKGSLMKNSRSVFYQLVIWFAQALGRITTTKKLGKGVFHE
jgi:hypothetical protein